MGRVDVDYARALLALLPPGAAFSRDEDTVLFALLLALGAEPARVDQAAAALLEELFPATATDTLQDWARLVGVPEAGDPPPVDLEDLRKRIAAKMASGGGINPAFYLALADAYGHAGATITTFPFEGFLLGSSQLGVTQIGVGRSFDWEINLPDVVVIPNFALGQSLLGATCLTTGQDLAFEKAVERHNRATRPVTVTYGV